MSYRFPPSIDAGNKTWGRNMSDDTQNPNTEPGCDDVLPPLHVSRSYVDVNDPLTLRLADAVIALGG